MITFCQQIEMCSGPVSEVGGLIDVHEYLHNNFLLRCFQIFTLAEEAATITSSAKRSIKS